MVEQYLPFSDSKFNDLYGKVMEKVMEKFPEDDLSPKQQIITNFMVGDYLTNTDFEHSRIVAIIQETLAQSDEEFNKMCQTLAENYWELLEDPKIDETNRKNLMAYIGVLTTPTSSHNW